MDVLDRRLDEAAEPRGVPGGERLRATRKRSIFDSFQLTRDMRRVNVGRVKYMFV